MIALIYISEVRYCPYLSVYTDVLDKLKLEYEVLYWNREKVKINYPDHFISFEMKSSKKKRPINKIVDFLKFRCWIIDKLKKNKYKKIVALSTLSGMIIADYLLKYFSNNYILDIRDYSYENNPIFYQIEKKLIEKSYFTAISSAGFTSFLPDSEYKIVHNIITDDLVHQNGFIKKKSGSTLNVVFVGGLRYFNHQRNIISHLSNDNRFKMFYHGSGIETDKFKEYALKNKINNIVFTGAYENHNKYKLLKNADILNNSYNSEKTMEIKHSISNKYYDGLVFSIPQLSENGTYKAKKVETNNLGIGLDVYQDDFADILYKYYYSIDEDVFNRNAKQELQNVLKDNKKFEENLIDFFS